MDIKGSETHLLPGWGGCPVKMSTEKIQKSKPRLSQRGQSVAETSNLSIREMLLMLEVASLAFRSCISLGVKMRKNLEWLSVLCKQSPVPVILCNSCMQLPLNKVYWKYIGCLWCKRKRFFLVVWFFPLRTLSTLGLAIVSNINMILQDYIFMVHLLLKSILCQLPSAV